MCIPNFSMGENLIKENDSGGLGGHFGANTTYEQVNRFYFLPKMRCEVEKYVKNCKVCQYAKGRSQNTCLYVPLPILYIPWDMISIYLFLGLPKTKIGHDSIYVVIYKFSKITPFIPSYKTINIFNT